MTQQELADSLGIAQNTYSQIENGTRQINMDLSFAKKISEIFNLPIEKIWEYENAHKK
jgi:DNA-binding XRE family transcriptional regulator